MTTATTFSSFNANSFRESVRKALQSVEKILNDHRHHHPYYHLPENIDHTYQNKYDLVNILTNITIIAQVNILDQLGISIDVLQSMLLQQDDKEQQQQQESFNINNHNKKQQKQVTLRFQASDTCNLLKTVHVKVPIRSHNHHQQHSNNTQRGAAADDEEENNNNQTNNTTSTMTIRQKRRKRWRRKFFGVSHKTQQQQQQISHTNIVQHQHIVVTEYHWHVGISWEIILFVDEGTNNNINNVKQSTTRRKRRIQSRTCSNIIITQNETPPTTIQKENITTTSTTTTTTTSMNEDHPISIDLSLSWLLSMMNFSSNKKESTASSPSSSSPSSSSSHRSVHFQIDRYHPMTRTPRRNNDIDQALQFTHQFQIWAHQVQTYLKDHIEGTILYRHNPAADTVASNASDAAFSRQETVTNDKEEKEEKTTTNLIHPNQQHTINNPPHRSLNHISSQTIFCPIFPILVESTELKIIPPTVESEREEDCHHESVLSFEVVRRMEEVDSELDSSSPLLTGKDWSKLLDEQIRTLNEAMITLQTNFPPPKKEADSNIFISSSEASLVLLSCHIEDLMTMYHDGVDYIESMLYDQLVAAIGKEVQATDLDEFVKFHTAKLFRPAPQPMCRVIRQSPYHCPVGVWSIEQQQQQQQQQQPQQNLLMGDEDNTQPLETIVIETIVRPLNDDDSSSVPLQIPLDAATTVQLAAAGGSRLLHGWVQHRFGVRRTTTSHNLMVRARQFSSFVLILGTMIDGNCLNPKDAIILQNKDEVIIPLLLNELPTSQEFKDAIQSLSPEQQRFATAFRSMQLDTSVFGICIIPIQPQLEMLLGLPCDALQKEMKLTQDLLTLFIEYQIPSDLLSYDGRKSTDVLVPNVMDQVENVKSHVKDVLDMIGETKMMQLQDTTMQADMVHEQKKRQQTRMEVTYLEAEEKDTFASYSDLVYWDDTLVEEIHNIQGILERIEPLSDPNECASAIEKAEIKLRSVHGTKRSYKMETRLVQDTSVRRRLEGRLQQMENILRNLKADLKALRVKKSVPEMRIDGTQDLAEQAQWQDDCLSNTKSMINASKSVGIATLEELQRQREVLQGIEGLVLDGSVNGLANDKRSLFNIFTAKKKKKTKSFASGAKKATEDMFPQKVKPSSPKNNQGNGDVSRGGGGTTRNNNNQSTSKPDSQGLKTEPADVTFQCNPSSDNPPDRDVSGADTVDVTSIPKLLDATIAIHDTDNALRNTIITVDGTCWTRHRQQHLLSQMKTTQLFKKEIQSEKNKAFDLLDALSKSGSLPICTSELHVIVSVTHCFEKNVMETVIQDNINPIEKLEKSTLMVASAIHGIPVRELVVNSSKRLRLADSFPQLFLASPIIATSEDDC